MSYLIKQIQKSNEIDLGFVKKINEQFLLIQSQNIEDIVHGIVKIKSQFNVLRVQLEKSESEQPPDQHFISKFSYFLEENGEKIILLE